MTEKKKIDPVVTGEVKVSNKKKIKESFIAKDAKTVGNSVIFDVIIPSIKNITYDIFNRGIRMFLFGDSTAPSNSGSNVRPYQQISFTPYGQAYKPISEQQKPRQIESSNGFDYENFVFSSRSDAEAVLLQMSDIIEEYGTVTVSDLYEICRKTAPYTSDNYGWKSMANAKVGVCSEGFTIIFPKSMPIN